MGEVLVVPSPAGGYVELAGRVDPHAREQYPRFRKHILNLGTLKYEGNEYRLDDNWYARLKDNFTSGVSMCQVPLANDSNKHSEDPLRNTGEIVGLEREGNKVYTVVEIREPEVARKLRNKTIMGASAFLAMDYRDTRSGKKVGPALLHHCLTNRPYVLDLEPYEEVIAASADMDGDQVIILSEGAMPQTKEELIAALRELHGVDVEALQQRASAPDQAALTAALTEALRGTGIQLSAGQEGSISLSDITGSIVELAARNTALTEDVAKLRLSNATAEVEALIGAGRLLPKTREVAIELALTNREQLDAITAPANAPYVKLGAQAGRPAPDGEEKHEQDIDGELARLTAEHPDLFTGGTK
jgi:hypothetical protein